MPCKHCGKKPVIELQQGNLCSDCFTRYFQKKVFKTIRRFKLFSKRDRLCVACSGDNDSLCVLYLVNKIASQQRQPIFVIHVDEGIVGFSDKRAEKTIRFCEDHGIDCLMVSFEEEYGVKLEEMVAKENRKKKNKIKDNCLICKKAGNKLIERYARELGATRIVVGNNLDNEARNILSYLLNEGFDNIDDLGPIAVMNGKGRGKKIVRGKVSTYIKPLYFCTDQEVKTFAKNQLFKSYPSPCPHWKTSREALLNEKLNELDKKFKGTKTALVQNLINMLPMIRIEHKKSRTS